MRGHVTSAADDIIVEPIKEAVAVYDKLLKELRTFMVSDFLFGRSVARSKEAGALACHTQ